MAIPLMVDITSRRLAYALAEEKEHSKEEKAFGQSWEITRFPKLSPEATPW
jgi:hypothetical protein